MLTRRRFFVGASAILAAVALGAILLESGGVRAQKGEGGSVPATSPLQEKAHRRIVSLAPSITESLFALGLGDRIVGVTSFCDYPPEALTRSKVGGYYDLNYEAIVALEPDLVVCLPEHEGRLADLDRLNLRAAKNILFFATSLMVGVIVARCGPIGFVGMMAPHICRLPVGVITALLGGPFFVWLLISDGLGRTGLYGSDGT